MICVFFGRHSYNALSLPGVMTPSGGTRPSTSTSLQEAFERDGFVVVRGVLDEDTVAALRLDADRRAHGLHLDADSTVWVHDNQHLALNDVARTQAGPYLALRGDDSPLIARALLTTLPAVVAAATGWVADLRLFNEHYVIKPPGGGQHFLWHRDADRHDNAHSWLVAAVATKRRSAERKHLPSRVPFTRASRRAPRWRTSTPGLHSIHAHRKTAPSRCCPRAHLVIAAQAHPLRGRAMLSSASEVAQSACGCSQAMCAASRATPFTPRGLTPPRHCVACTTPAGRMGPSTGVSRRAAVS